ncbi:uncharacterized lipoprotein YehR (DUF1307 family) [Pullulanibacillus pueri]|nr:uncharacterized lipoprotein YehR (DUF1307 family) [Pullulanibacillus pueri]
MALFSLLLVFALTACGGSASTNSNNSSGSDKKVTIRIAW